MSAQALAWFRLQFPSLVEPDALQGLLRALHGLSTPGRRDVWGLQLVARRGTVEHYLAGPEGLQDAVTRQAATAIPGLVLEPVGPPTLPRPRLAWRIWQSTARRPLRTEAPEESTRALLSALTGVGEDEAVVVSWLLGPVRRPMAVPDQLPTFAGESWPKAIGTAATGTAAVLDRSALLDLRSKVGEPGWRAVGRIAITANVRPRAFQLLGRVTGALRTVESPGVTIGVRPIPVSAVLKESAPWRWGLALSVPEVVALSGYPLGEAVSSLPVSRRSARLLPAPASVPRRGRVLAIDPNGDRPYAVSVADSARHLWVMGPTGSGKSVLATHLIAQAMADGQAVICMEPKSDLIADCLALVPPERRDDVVVLDPTDVAPIGLNPLHSGERPELVADQLLSMLAGLHTDSWGPRLGELLHTALLTLAKTPGTSLAMLPALLTNSGFRRRLTSRIDDPLGVTPIWQAFDALSPEAQAQMTAAVLNKIRPLVGRSDLRAVLGQAEPLFKLVDVFTERKILFIDLAKGKIGPDSARLLGTLVLNQIWQTVLSRGAIPKEQRHVVSLIVDEFQDFVGLPGDFGDILAQARGLGLSFGLLHQHLDQLPESLQRTVLANARTRVITQTDSQDAALLARGHREIEPEDFASLPAYEAYLRVCVDGAVTPYFSGKLLPPREPTVEADVIRGLSRERYGRDRHETDELLKQFITGSKDDKPIIGSRRRSA